MGARGKDITAAEFRATRFVHGTAFLAALAEGRASSGDAAQGLTVLDEAFAQLRRPGSPVAPRVPLRYGRVPVIVYVWFTQGGLRKLQSGPEHVNWNTPSHVVRSRKVPVSEYVTGGTTACTEKSPPPADPVPPITGSKEGPPVNRRLGSLAVNTKVEML